MSNMLASAIAYASQLHVGQVDKGGYAYILHPIRVMMGVKGYGEEVMCMAILHDVMEDCGVSVDDLRERGISERVIEGLECLTHRDGEEYEEYIGRVLCNRDAMLVKREDLRDNSDLTRLRGIGKKDIERMERYMVAWRRVEAVLGGKVDPSPVVKDSVCVDSYKEMVCVCSECGSNEMVEDDYGILMCDWCRVIYD